MILELTVDNPKAAAEAARRRATAHAGLKRWLRAIAPRTVHMNESMNKFLRATRELEKELGRAPTNEEISRRMDIPVEETVPPGGKEAAGGDSDFGNKRHLRDGSEPLQHVDHAPIRC
jgi:hypothetical protein